MKKPNILYLHSHDTGRYVQPYGYAVPTPSLQRLAEQGVLFRRCFCAAPTCSASRAALLTGQSPHGSGMIGLAHRGISLKDYNRHLAAVLRPAGYFSALAGVQHLMDFRGRPDRLPYDAFLDFDEAGRRLSGPADSIEGHAEAFLKGGPARPFFLDVGFSETHRAFPADFPPGVDVRYVRPPEPIPDTPEGRRDMAGFIAKAITLDAKMGRVLAALDASGLADGTLVICTTDHGIAFPRMKCNLTDGGIGVMLILRGPGGFDGGRVCEAMVSQIDIFSTLCELLDIDPPDWLEGVSFLPVIDGRAEKVREELFSEVTYHAAYEPMRCIRTERHKYIRRFEDLTRPVLSNCDDGPSKTLWMNSGWSRMAPDREALYDLIFDPAEQNNLVGRAEMAPTLNDLRARLDRWMRETDDPLLAGPVPAPKGAQLNRQDDVSPQEPLYTVE